MQFCDAVDREGTDHTKVCHTDVVAADDRDLVQEILVVAFAVNVHRELTVDLLDDHVDTRQELFDVFDRPAFQRFRHNGMVGVGEGLSADRSGFSPAVAVFIHHKTHEFRDRQSRMCIVQLNDMLFGKVVQRAVLFHMFLDDELQSGGNEEVFLLDAQVFAFLGRVIRIDVAADIVDVGQIFTEVDIRSEIDARFRRPHPQGVRCFSVRADHRHLIRDSADGLAADSFKMQITVFIGGHIDRTVEVYVDCPVMAADFPLVTQTHPLVRDFDLLVVENHLFEETELIADRIAGSRIVAGCKRIHEAGCETTQTAVSEAGVFFELKQFFEIDIQILQTFLDEVVGIEIHKIVAQHSAKQEFQREVMHLFGFLFFHTLFRFAPVH